MLLEWKLWDLLNHTFQFSNPKLRESVRVCVWGVINVMVTASQFRSFNSYTVLHVMLSLIMMLRGSLDLVGPTPATSHSVSHFSNVRLCCA